MKSFNKAEALAGKPVVTKELLRMLTLVYYSQPRNYYVY